MCVLGCKYFRYVSSQEYTDYFIDSLFSAYCLHYGREAYLKCVLERGDSDDCTRILNKLKHADRAEIELQTTRIVGYLVINRCISYCILLNGSMVTECILSMNISRQ